MLVPWQPLRAEQVVLVAWQPLLAAQVVLVAWQPLLAAQEELGRPWHQEQDVGGSA